MKNTHTLTNEKNKKSCKFHETLQSDVPRPSVKRESLFLGRSCAWSQKDLSKSGPGVSTPSVYNSLEVTETTPISNLHWRAYPNRSRAGYVVVAGDSRHKKLPTVKIEVETCDVTKRKTGDRTPTG